jgi:hypothetical protein
VSSFVNSQQLPSLDGQVEDEELARNIDLIKQKLSFQSVIDRNHNFNNKLLYNQVYRKLNYADTISSAQQDISQEYSD